MAFRRGRPIDIGRARCRELARRFGVELRIARTGAGLTQEQLAKLAGVSQGEVSRAEGGDPRVSAEIRCRLAAACGHELAWRLYPVSTVRLRDSGQLAIAEAIIGASAAVWRPALEVPVAPGDARAADLVLAGPEELLQIEIERRLVDFQAQSRAAQLKREVISQSDVRPVRLVIALPDGRSSRELLAQLPGHVSQTFPLSSAAVWRAIRNGTPLGGDGILLVRPDRARRPGCANGRSTGSCHLPGEYNSGTSAPRSSGHARRA